MEVPQIPTQIAQEAAEQLRRRKSPTLRSMAHLIIAVASHMRTHTEDTNHTEVIISNRRRKLAVGVSNIRVGHELVQNNVAYFGEVSGNLGCWELHKRGDRLRSFRTDYEGQRLGEPVSLPRELRRNVLEAIASGEVTYIG